MPFDHNTRTAAPGGQIAKALSEVSAAQREGLLLLRRLILQRAQELPEVGRVEEALRWGQPAFLTPETKAGCSLRIGPYGEDEFAIFVHCQTDLIERFRSTVGEGFRTEGTRAVIFGDLEFEHLPIQHLIGWALTYHLSRRAAAASNARA